MTNARLIHLNEIWEKQLETCNYVGEICLYEDDLCDLGSLFKECSMSFIKPVHYKSAILVAAVNCAYYYYDDKGFWHHFTKLTGYENTEGIGNLVEKRLKGLGLIAVERSGPFRYVGVILEQCGISKRYFSTYAGILRHLKSRLGANFGIMNKNNLKELLDQIDCQKYLKNFLIDPSGIEFTSQVCNLLAMYEEGWINSEELFQLKGFMPGFWEFMINEFDVNIRKNWQNSSKNTSYSKPGFINSKGLGDILVPNYGDASVQKDSKLEGDRYRRVVEASVTLNWNEPENFSFEHHTELDDVFIDNIPTIEVSNFNPIQNGRTGLFYDIGFDKGRIRSEKELIKLRDRVNKEGMVKGRIWTQVFERTRLAENEIRSELTFIVIPNVLKNVPRLLGNTDYIFHAASVVASSRCRLQLNHCTLLDSMKQEWKIPSNLTELIGSIQSPTIKIGFNIPFNRITLKLNEEKVKYVEMKELLNKPDISLRITPNTTFQVLVNQSYIKLTSNDAGFSTIPSKWILNIPGNDEGISPIYLNVSGTVFSTGTYLIEFETLKRRLLKEKSSIKDTADSNMNLVFKLTDTIINNPGTTIKMNGVPKLFEKFDIWLRTIFSCAAIFDNTKFIVENYKMNWLEEIKSDTVKSYFMKLEQKKYDQIESTPEEIPMIPRWEKIVQDGISQSTKAGRVQLLTDWSADISRRRKFGMTSKLAKEPDIKEISKAWIHYLNDRTKQALTILENSSVQSDFGQALATILIALIFLREARFNPAMAKLETQLEIEELEQVRDFLYSLVYSFHYNKDRIIFPESMDNMLDTLKTLPFKEEDRILFHNYYTFLNKKEIWDNIDKDWLSLMGRFFILIKLDKKELNHSVLNIKSSIPQIPASPERADIIEKLDQIR